MCAYGRPDLRVWQLRADLPADAHSVTVREPDVEDRDVRVGRRDPGQGLRDRAGLADDLDVGFGLQERGDALADDLVIIQKEHPDGRSLGVS
jgi:hypothetical protein